MSFLFKYITPDGFDNLMLHSDGEALLGLWFEGSRDVDKREYIQLPTTSSMPPILCSTCHWLDIYFSGQQPDFTPKYQINGLTPFRKEVLEHMLQIPFGMTVTYGSLATEIAQQCNMAASRVSARAVGGAVGWNPICLIIPCHRVIGADGSLTGYGGGLHNKKALLRMEGHIL